MGATAEETGSLRVIALVYPSTGVEELCPRAQWVRPAGAYEAGAELLAELPAALVVDLGRVTSGHGGLLSLAARLAVPVVAFGEVSADLGSDALASARLVARDRVAEALGAILPAEAAVEEESPPPSDPPSAEPEPPPATPRPAETLTQAELDALLG